MTNASDIAEDIAEDSAETALIFGLGFTGRTIAERLRADGGTVRATTRDGRNGTLAFDGHATDALREAVRDSALIVSTVPPARDGTDPVLSAFGDFPRARALVYLSATSVYGDRGGQWAFEGEVPRPRTVRGRARVEAELRWLETGRAVYILRCAGIYGPGRSAFDKLHRAVIKPGHVVNRIHVADIADMISRIAALPMPAPGIYNVADGHPAPPEEVIAAAARMAGAPRPRRVGWRSDELSPMARSFYAETKRVDIAKARQRLGWSPAYPTYRSGLRAIRDAIAETDRNS